MIRRLIILLLIVGCEETLELEEDKKELICTSFSGTWDRYLEEGYTLGCTECYINCGGSEYGNSDYGENTNSEGDITITISSEGELDRAYASCKRERDDDGFDCGQLVLPASYSMPDGSTITVENESGYQAIRDWQEANPDAGGEVTLAYPFDMTFKDADGNEITITINNDEEYRAAQIEYCLTDRD